MRAFILTYSLTYVSSSPYFLLLRRNVIIIMDPLGSLLFMIILHFFVHEDTDMRAGEVGNLLYWPGLDPGISVL